MIASDSMWYDLAIIGAALSPAIALSAAIAVVSVGALIVRELKRLNTVGHDMILHASSSAIHRLSEEIQDTRGKLTVSLALVVRAVERIASKVEDTNRQKRVPTIKAKL